MERRWEVQGFGSFRVCAGLMLVGVVVYRVPLRGVADVCACLRVLDPDPLTVLRQRLAVGVVSVTVTVDGD